MKVLLACEESQAVCIEFRKRGHEAYSCDIQACSGGHPEWHIQNDVLLVLKGGLLKTESGDNVSIDKWDLIIGFPPCTYLSNAGAAHLYAGKKLNEDRYKKGLEGKTFFMEIFNSDCEKIGIENPTPSKVYGLPKPSQVIEPYYFGSYYKKRTCLWLKGLPPLMHNKQPNLFDKEVTHVDPLYHHVNSSSNYRNGTLQPGPARNAKHRSKTFPEIAKAMAEQWG